MSVNNQLEEALRKSELYRRDMRDLTCLDYIIELTQQKRDTAISDDKIDPDMREVEVRHFNDTLEVLEKKRTLLSRRHT